MIERRTIEREYSIFLPADLYVQPGVTLRDGTADEVTRGFTINLRASSDDDIWSAVKLLIAALEEEPT